jgi:hypothetical protein
VNCVFAFHQKEVVENGPEVPSPVEPSPKEPSPKEKKEDHVFEEVKTEIVNTKKGEIKLTKNISRKRKKKNVQIEMFTEKVA